jgi:hypothetical protein
LVGLRVSVAVGEALVGGAEGVGDPPLGVGEEVVIWLKPPASPNIVKSIRVPVR